MMEPMDENPRPQSTLSRIGNFFKGNQNTQKKLYTWKQCGEQEDWASKAVGVLVKKLKKQPSGIKKIENALKTQNPLTDCVKIPRSIDGRLQISNCKALPHVIYCRIWRWPDLQSHHELRSVRNCESPFNAKIKTDLICVNPYHYERVESGNIFPPVLVPRHSEFAPGFSKLPAQQSSESIQMPNNIVFDGILPHSQSSSYQGSPSSYNGYQTNCSYSHMVATPSPSHYVGNNTGYDSDNCVQVHYEEPEYWASVAYYELNCRVGEQFQCSTNSNTFVVDGFTNPTTSNRFCLGQLSNVNRNSTIEATRKHIGKGIRVFMENTEIWLECMSESSVFVQSPMTNHQYGLAPNTVCKVTPNIKLKLFDKTEFWNLLNQVVLHGFEDTYKLTKMCTIRMSFVKGWGAQYHRQDVTSTPCWCEIHLHGPLKWLDKVLKEMGSPHFKITSQS